MAVITQTRSLASVRARTQLNGGSITSTYADGLIAGGNPVQTTTSFRTGRGHSENSSAVTAQGGGWADKNRDLARESEYRTTFLRPYDNGHAFSSEKKECHATMIVARGTDSNGNRVFYDGPLTVKRYSGSTPSWGSLGSFNHAAYAAKALSATIPTKGVNSLAVTLAELRREGFPIPGQALREYLLAWRNGGRGDALRVAASEHLNHEFGTKPIKDEVEGLYRTTKEWRQRLEQAERDSSRRVRRKHRDPIVIETTIPYTGQGVVGHAGASTAVGNLLFDGVNGRQTAWYRESRVYTRKVWFSGAYMYEWPEGRRILDKVRRMEFQFRTMLGLKLDTEVLWNLTPWSWLVDWNSKIGTSLGNAELFSRDGLVLQYGYTMCESTEIIRRNGALTPNPDYHSSVPVFVENVLTNQSKTRQRVDPYGVSLLLSNYTSRQWAILGSLGMTKAPKVLWRP